jgi:hypothetical protein
MSQSTTDSESGDEQLYQAVTWFEASDDDADIQTLQLGAYDEPQTIREPQQTDAGAVYVRQRFEPVATVEFDMPYTRADALAWIDTNRQHPGFDGFDWDAHDRRTLLGEIVETRARHLSYLEEVARQLGGVAVVSATAKAQLDGVRSEIADLVANATPTEVELTPEDDETEEA